MAQIRAKGLSLPHKIITKLIPTCGSDLIALHRVIHAALSEKEMGKCCQDFAGHAEVLDVRLTMVKQR